MVEINPRKAQELGLSEDERVMLVSGKEKVVVRIHIYAGCPPDMVYMPTGLGHKSLAEPWSLDKGVNYSRLAAVQKDLLSGQLRWNLSKVRLEKIL